MTKRSDFEIEGLVVGDLVEHKDELWQAWITSIEMHGDRDGFEVICRIDGPVFEYYYPQDLTVVTRNPEFEEN